MRPITPRGFRDAMPPEAEEREAVTRAIGDVFASWGYRAVETPAVEDLRTVEAAAGPLEDTAFRLIDLDGRLLVLRPDMTVPIARIVASRLQGTAGPHRFRYAASVFREHESLRGQPRQFTQVGVELVGEAGPSADAEVVSVLVEALAGAGVPSFTVGIGTVEVLKAIVDAADASDEWTAAVLEAAHKQNLVGLAELSKAAEEPVASALRTVPRIRGGKEAIEACREATRGLGCEAALDSLAQTWELLEVSGAAKRALVDFSIMRSFEYYTGMVVEVYAPGVGLPLGGGGRYDGVLEAYGAPTPAAGFALGLERVMIALVEQGAAVATRTLDAVVGGEAGAALGLARELREAGWSVALSAREGVELAGEAERLGAAEALLAQRGHRPLRLDRAGGVLGELEEGAARPGALRARNDGGSGADGEREPA
jgi:ATP phosphoribosyltransferase